MFNLAKRINRKTYWLGNLYLMLGLIFFALFITYYPFNESKAGEFEAFPDIPLIILLIFIIWFGICLTRQRANDISGKRSLIWFFMAFFILGPIIGLIPGEKSKNRYGPASSKLDLH
jgi:uncharacterized membrane protein YhaH (DUF805 family)